MGFVDPKMDPHFLHSKRDIEQKNRGFYLQQECFGKSFRINKNHISFANLQCQEDYPEVGVASTQVPNRFQGFGGIPHVRLFNGPT